MEDSELLESKYYTYMYLRQEDATPYYVGKGAGARAYTQHNHRVRRPKYEHLIIVQHWESEEKAFEIEKWWIKFWGRKDIGTGILRNMTDGGDAPPNQKGVPKSAEHRRKIGAAHKGKTVSEETREKTRKARAKQVMGPASEETKKKMSASAYRIWEERKSRSLCP